MPDSPERRLMRCSAPRAPRGGGLVRALLANPKGEFRARAITRDPNSDRARQLSQLGTEVVAGNVDDESSLSRAFEGAWGA